MNREWLLENSSIPIKYILTKDSNYFEQLFDNAEIQLWFSKLSDRVSNKNLSNIHGSHDYRFENIIGKCFILGLTSDILKFDVIMRFFIDFLNEHITRTYDDALTFGKMYQYRDYETILSCYLPFLGYAHEKSVQYVAHKRINTIYQFTQQERYDIYSVDRKYPGAKKEWKPYIVNQKLYGDGNIALPSIHDFILFAGMYAQVNDEIREKIKTSVKWIFNEKYKDINNCYYYYAHDDPSYKSKGINYKVNLMDFNSSVYNKEDIQGLLYHCFIFSHFAEARNSKWFSQAILYLEEFKTEAGLFMFPASMIAEQTDRYVFKGGHMNVGECKKNKNYSVILSTYWMEKIYANF